MQTPIGVIQQSFPCHNCHGVGSTFVNNCLDCNGTGSKSIEEIIEVVSPPGIREDSAFIMHGKVKRLNLVSVVI
jgi:DnaJ-class molecular chaperone